MTHTSQQQTPRKSYIIMMRLDGATIDSAFSKRRDHAARVYLDYAKRLLRARGKGEAIGGNYGHNARPDSSASKFYTKALEAASRIRAGDLSPFQYVSTNFPPLPGEHVTDSVTIVCEA